MTPQEAAQHLDSICQELKNYNVEPDDIEALRQISLRFRFHFAKLESFQRRLRKWVVGFPC
jgi:hypothetical protein